MTVFKPSIFGLGKTTSAALVTVLVLGTVALALFILDGTGVVDLRSRDPLVPETGDNAAATFEGGPPELLLISGTSLMRKDIIAGDEEMLLELPGPAAVAALGSPWIAYVENENVVESGGTVVPQPALHLYNTAAGEEADLGVGFAPLWNASGTRVAYLKPINPEECAGGTCAGESQVVVADPGAPADAAVLLAGGRWTLLSWAGDRLMIAEESDTNTTVTVSLDGERGELDIPPSEIWGASPDGAWLVRAETDEVSLVPLNDGVIGGEPTPVEMEGRLADGSWSHDSTQVAAVVSLSEAPTKGLPVSEIVVFSPEDPAARVVEESAASVGDVLWSVDGTNLVFTRVVDPKAGTIQAFYCSSAAEGVCRTLSSWTSGVQLLRTE